MPSSPGPGQKLGRYRLTREVGRGAMGQVFVAEDTVLGQPVCVKLLHPQYLHHPEAVARFSRELVLARRIAHPGICRVYDLHEDGGQRFLTMEYVEGAPLKELVGTRVPVVQALRITQHLCEALAAAHDKGVIHRDLKPGNIMVRAGTDDDVCILDFGIAAAEDTAAQGLTRPGVALGTRLYIAPEVWAGSPATTRSDLFAVGVILFRLLTTQMPWGSEDIGVLERMRTEPARRPSSLRPDVPAVVDALLASALANRPEDRIASAQAFARACADAVAALTSSAPSGSHRDVATRVERPAHMIVDSDEATSAPSSWQAAPTRVQPRPVSMPDAPTRSVTDPIPDSTSSPDPPDPFPQDRTDQVSALVSSDEASWVVSGRPVDSPVRPKAMHVVAAPTRPDPVTGTELVDRPRRRSRAGLAAGVVLGVTGVALAALIVLGPPATTTTETVPPATEIVPDGGPTGQEIAPVVQEIAPATAADAGAEAAVVDAGVEAVVQAVVQAVVIDAGVEAAVVDAGVVEPAVVEPAVSTPSRPKAGGAARAAAAQALKDVAAAMRARGLVPGDDGELDRLKKAATRQQKARQYDAAVASADGAIARVAAVRIDRALVERKLTRFNALFDREQNAAKKARLDDVAGRASLDFAAGRLDAANRALNEGFAILGKDR